jgi:hypothetical protein
MPRTGSRDTAGGMANTTPQAIRDLLARNRREAVQASQRLGHARLQELLRRAQRDLEKRLRRAEGLQGPGKGSFTAVQARVLIKQVKDVTSRLTKGVGAVVLDNAREAAGKSAEHLVEYLHRADQAFRGVHQPMQLREAAVFDAATMGAESSVLRRLGSDPEHPARKGILERYGLETVGSFEQSLQQSLITRAPWADVRQELIDKSTFLQGMPMYWAERIVRTETHGAYQRGQWEGTKEAQEQLGDVVKILSATFDDRTAADSYAVHGQVRNVEEPFQSWFGFYQHPPNRPNDREVVVTHRLAWPFPPYLKWKTNDQVVARWREEGHKKPCPPRPLMTTVPLSKFGKEG